ncbi:MAG: aminotransferase class V-fold PLP-dependent enzyme [Clostridium sp.]|uniref:aminotransferase class V-fold PLP-dependent enzyme n=1 Tax=Clostridium sp. TaxID=1506 RepID=UPI002672F933|nr:aminotransferase class V-fold PLP-dependent enzyme [Clostridium sp.]MDD7682785.1 aminotransferase class V-fold PLP-dependent enzyme [Clostridium sp.]MDY2578949.1 aminotransferase class V-fold PLP-dependent enzyme [Clostridium sp.]
MIYLDNAATTMKKPQCVIDAVVAAMSHMGNAGRGATSAALDASRIIYDTREKISDLFNLQNPSRVAFTCNSTESLNTAIKGILSSGDHAITTALEHNSVLRPLYDLQAKGMELSIVDCDENGNIDYNDFEKLIKENTKAIVCTHASNLVGNVLDVKKIGSIAKKHNLIFIVDASQSAGVFPIDMQDMNIDILCFTGHKGLLGPQGTGGICVREGIDVRPLKVGGSGVNTFSKEQPVEMPTHLEAGTLNGHAIAGLNAALDYLKEEGIDNIQKREEELMFRFYNGIKDIKDIKIFGNFENKRAAIVTFNVGDIDSAAFSDELSFAYDISTRAGAHCAPLMHKAMNTVEQGAVRFSFSHYNTEEEIDTAIKAVKEIAASY